MIKIKIITTTETYPIRQVVLRKGKAIETCYIEGDELPTTTHYGIFKKNKLIGVVSSFYNNNNLFENKNQIQLRGMAILETEQKKGFGNMLIKCIEKDINTQNISLIWFNARENTILFYEKLGYSILGNQFEILGIGKHYMMYKKLSI